METTTERFEEIAEENDLDVEAFVAFCDNQHIKEEDAEDAVDEFRDGYIGEFDSEEEFAEYFFDEEEAVQIPDLLRRHIDWSDVWHCELRHDFYAIKGHFFRNT